MDQQLLNIARKAHHEGRNIAEALRSHLGIEVNTPEIIEISYDLQAGSYVAFVEKNRHQYDAIAREYARRLDNYLQNGDVLLDIGSGELTTLSFTMAHIKARLSRVYACDISEARLRVGLEFAARNMKQQFSVLQTLQADFAALPFNDKSVDVVTSIHALEPNGGREDIILQELLRIAKRKLVLFEPCYELASEAGKARMDSHGYVRGIAKTAERLGGTVEVVEPLDPTLLLNPLNPTTCFVIAS